MAETVLITGGARGIGRALSVVFSRAGYRVVVHCNSSIESARELCAELDGAEYISCDLSTEEGVRALADFCPEPDILINNAGVALVTPFDAASPDDVKRTYSLNLHAPVELTRLLLPSFIRKKSGCIINISSVFGSVGASCEVDYSTAKAGIIGFTKALAKEVAPSGVRVNCICPGAIDTDMNSNLSDDEKSALCDEIPMGRMGFAEEVAAAALFLASDGASYITGTVLGVDGGWN